MRTPVIIEAWHAISETSELACRFSDMPPRDRASAARKTLLRTCLVLREIQAAHYSDRRREVLKEAQRTLLHVRKLREAGSATVH
jgi:hypothetical protein